MKKACPILFIFLIPLVALGSHSVSPNPSTSDQDLNFTLVDGGNVVFIYQNPADNPGGPIWRCNSSAPSTFSASCISVADGSPISPPYPAGDYSDISYTFQDGYGCEALSYGECLGDPSRGNGHEYLFTILSPPPPPPPSGGAVPTADQGASGGGFNFKPEVAFLKIFHGTSTSGIVSIDYAAYDKDDDAGHSDYGLVEKPVSIFYGKAGIADWTLLAKDLPATGTVLWDTMNLTDGDNYKLRATVVDKKGEFTETIEDDITIDNTPPTFTVIAFPTFSQGQPVKITIESSEPLPDIPVLKVAQFKHEPIEVHLTPDNLKKNFLGIYRITQGFDGPAKISVLGADSAGNKNNVLLEDDTFSVGIKPPPPPTIETPKGEVKTTSSTLSLISGLGINAQKIIIRVNGLKKYTLANLERGRFKIENLPLNPKFNKGRNVISVVSEDESGIVSEPSKISVFVDSPPEISLTEPRSRTAQLNGLINFRWDAFDINDDPLIYQIELSKDGGSWSTLAKDLKEPHFVWDSTGVPDSSNYLARITASDGWLTTTIVSNRITISNDLPVIVLEESGEFFTSARSKTVNGVVKSKDDLLVKLESSLDGGKTWKSILPEDGKWDSAFEKFEFTLPSLKTGIQKIIFKGTSAQNKIVVNAQGLQVIFDDKAPSLIIDSLPSHALTARSVTLEGLALDDFSGIKTVEYKIDGSEWFEATLRGQIGKRKIGFVIKHSATLDDGNHEIDVRAADQARNLSKTVSQKFTIDATPPRIGSFTLETGGKIIFPNKSGVFEIKLGSALVFHIALAGDSKVANLSANEKPLDLKFNKKIGLWEGNFSFGKEGFVSLVFSAEDAAGNKAEKTLAQISVAANEPPNAVPMNKNAASGSFFQKLLKFFEK